MNTSLTLAGWHKPARTNFHGILVSVVVAVAAISLAEHYHISSMLFALLLGMALNFLSTEGRCVPGIRFSASTLLRIGVALLGVRITFGQITALGAMPVAIAPETATPSDQDAAYRESKHVRDYYRTTRI